MGSKLRIAQRPLTEVRSAEHELTEAARQPLWKSDPSRSNRNRSARFYIIRIDD